MLNNGADLNVIKELLGHASFQLPKFILTIPLTQLKKYLITLILEHKNIKIMQITIHSVRFDADQKLLNFINKKIEKLMSV